MFKDFLIAIWRSSWRDRSYAAVNLLGLSAGFACCLMLGQFLRAELTYDRHFDKHARIYRLVADVTANGTSRQTSWVPRAGAPMLARDYPQIESYVRFTDASLQDGLRLRHGDRTISWRRTYFASDTVFDVFSHRVLAGDPKSALKEPSTVAISRTLAEAYFGNANPIGQLLRTDAGESWKITLVFADLPPNTHLRYDALFADKIPLLRDAADQSGLREQLTRGFQAYTYLLMRPGFQPAEWPAMATQFVNRYIAEDARRAGQSLRVILQPLTRIHYADPVLGDPPSGNRAYLYGCIAVALFILSVACINYTNLATARALRRARSVAIRKILGARRGRLVLEFLGEAVLYALAAAALGAALAEVAMSLTPIGALIGQGQLDLSSDPLLLVVFFCAALVLGLVAGAYPALYLSAWMPAAAFSARGGGARRGARLREILVLLQFVMAVGVVAATLIMGSQMHYVATMPLGFERENQVMVTIRGTERFARVSALAQELRSNPNVLAVTQATLPPGRFDSGGFMPVEDDKGSMQQVRGAGAEVGAEFTAALGIQIVAGRGFSSTTPRGEYLVNESMAGLMRWHEPIGRRIMDGRVIGVVRDFHFRSLREPIAPLAMGLLDDDPGRVAEARRPFVQRVVIIRISGRDFAGTMRHIREVMTRFDPGSPFEYTMLDESLQDLYATEQRMLTLIVIFASLCILIACLGLFGLTAFATERRAREIAIRKVLGASPWQVVWLLSRRVVVLIAVGGGFAAAMAWLAMDEWLTGFAYRVSVSPILLSASIALAAGVALGTIALQSTRVARADPAETLRYE
jgi:putative ABC transport system permease protein